LQKIFVFGETKRVRLHHCYMAQTHRFTSVSLGSNFLGLLSFLSQTILLLFNQHNQGSSFPLLEIL